MPEQATIKKIAILGGGVSSMVTAMELTSAPDWKEKYDITVYQMGWRLGGKGASGRNADIANRIEEHGLHLWFGFYDNAFDLIQKTYEATNRPLTAPLSTWEEAFKPANLVVLEDLVRGKWEHWPFLFPTNNDMPGTMESPPSMWEYARRILALAHGHYGASTKAEQTANKPVPGAAPAVQKPGLLDKLFRFIKELLGIKDSKDPEGGNWFEGLEEWWKHIKEDIKIIEMDLGGRLLYGALRMVESTLEKHNKFHHDALLIFIERFLKWLWNKLEADIDANEEARRLWIAMDFALSNLRGMIADDVITKGFDVINNIDYRDWIKKHGASEITLDSAPVQAIYGLVFGGYKYYTFEAGTALRGALRMALTYRGSIYYRMQAGMGDTIFSPMYEVLHKRGVKFEFFHKVLNLQLDAAKKNIEAIEIGVQATLKPGIPYYDPLVNVKDLPCWPSTPKFELLEQGDELKAQKINLESYWSPWKDVRTKTLKWGHDYDIVVQGISLGAMPVIAKELIAARDDWKKMVKNVTATETQAFQLWFRPDNAGMGWPYWMKETPLSGTYKEPFDTWADMSHLILRESWPDAHYPNNIAYLCGPIEKRNIYESWDFSDHTVPLKAYEQVKKNALSYLKELSHHLWPKTSPDRDPSDFNYSLLVDLKDGQGTERFNQQFFRSNIDPTELYILSETGSSACRLKTDQNGFDNMYITGDWIDNGFNAGCVEAAVIAGKQTARAITGGNYEIHGEKDIV